MPELSVTEEQLERFEALRGELEAAFVDGYGHVRRRDAVDYLLDTYTPPVEERVRSVLDREVRDDEGSIDYPALQSIARNTEGVKGSGMTAEEMYAAVLEAKVHELEAGGTIGIGVGPRDRTGADADDGDAVDAGPSGSGPSDEADEPDGSDGTNESGAPREDDADAAGTEDPDEGTDDGSDAPDDGEGSAASASSNGGGGSQLQAMMNLLDTHEDKWRKAASGDAPYEVDLPDGGTEAARTKDDVKRILFTNY